MANPNGDQKPVTITSDYMKQIIVLGDRDIANNFAEEAPDPAEVQGFTDLNFIIENQQIQT